MCWFGVSVADMWTKIPNLWQLKVPPGLASRTHLVLEKWQELPLHGQKPLLISLRYEVSEALVALELNGNVDVLRHLNDLTVKNVRRVIGAADPDKRTLTIGTARVCDLTKPSAVPAKHPHRVKI
jgi:hypothetical protein